MESRRIFWENVLEGPIAEAVMNGREAVAKAFEGAAHHITLELRNNRLVANPMEPRVAVGDFEDHSGMHTLYTTSQNPHVIRLLMGAFVLGISMIISAAIRGAGGAK